MDKELPLGYSVKQYLSFQKDSSFFKKNDSSILENDKVMRLQLNDLRARIKAKIDSLVKVNNISKEFSKEMISYLSARIFSIKIDYFRLTKTFFTSGNMPESRFTDLVSCSNTIRTQNELKYYYNQLRDLTKFIIYSRGQIESIFDSASFQLFLHVVKDNFKGLVKNYLIADILYTALRNKVIGPTTAKMYANKECNNMIYKLVLTKIAERSGKLEKYASTKDGEFLLPFASKKPVTEDDLLKHYKSKLVLVDFWSSWCIPCRRELPLMIELKWQYTGKDIVFLTISIDKKFLEWQRANKAEKLSSEESFVMGTNDSVFVFKGNLIESIPRYLLFNKDGSLIDANAPSPGSQALKEMIDKYLKD
ncbi:MAG TPA: TlpA disulfide reductase family protein [Chitinophagaceae bacterium]|nr:TlpA disulfide reductase family protein [Chitinophagaceae bacterium]